MQTFVIYQEDSPHSKTFVTPGMGSPVMNTEPWLGGVLESCVLLLSTPWASAILTQSRVCGLGDTTKKGNSDR